MSIHYRELKRRYELEGPRQTVTHLREALRAGHLRPSDFSLRDLAESLIPDGREWVRGLDPASAGGASLLEAGEAVDVTAFLNVTGQVVYERIMESYQHEAFVVSKLVSTIPTRFDGEKLPGATRVPEPLDEIHPGMPYPSLGFGEDYIETPPTAKHGLIVPVTREAIYFDRTHLVLSRAAEVGEVLGLNKERRLLDVVLGLVNNYKWRGTSHDTYQTSGPWVNVKTANELIDHTDVDAAEQLFAEMVDPSTGQPVLVLPNSVLVMPAYHQAAYRVFNALEIRYQPSGAATQTLSANPLSRYQVAESRLAYRQLVDSGLAAEDARQWWFLGDFARAFAYMENWPITVTQSPPGSEADFTQDVVVRFKASERGAAAVLDPRYVVKCTG